MYNKKSIGSIICYSLFVIQKTNEQIRSIAAHKKIKRVA